MMGERTVAQEPLFYEFSMERHVPADHILRSVDRFVDLSGIREHLRPFYSVMGRPSIDPELMKGSFLHADRGSLPRAD
jgi:transposase